MKIINKNGKIYLRFTSSSKTIEKSLKMAFCEQNFKYASEVLLPIFAKIAKSSVRVRENGVLRENLQNKRVAKKLRKIKIATHKIRKNGENLSDFCARNFAKISTNCKITTIKTAENAINRFFDFCADKKIGSYKVADFESVALKMQSVKLSPSTIRAIFGYISRAFESAVLNGVVTRNILKMVRLPKIKRENAEILAKSQIAKLLKTATGELKIFCILPILLVQEVARF